MVDGAAVAASHQAVAYASGPVKRLFGIGAAMAITLLASGALNTGDLTVVRRVLACAVPVLIGSLLAMTRLLGTARADRAALLSARPEPDAGAVQPSGNPSAQDVARQLLSLVGVSEESSIDIVITPASEPAPAAPRIPDDLGDRDRALLQLVAEGATNAEIGHALYLSEATVKGRITRLMRRFGCANRTQLAVLASGWTEQGRSAGPEVTRPPRRS